MMLVLTIILCLLTSLVTSGPLNTVITRGVGPHKTSFRLLNEYQEEDQDTYFIPSMRYGESDQKQTAMMDSDATKFQDYSPYAIKTKESSLSPNYQESSPTEKSADYQANKDRGFGDNQAPSMMGQVIRMGKAAIPDTMSAIMPAMVPILALYIGFQVISAIVAYTYGLNSSILSAWNQVMRSIASAIVNFFSGVFGSSDGDGARSERALNELTSMVYQAIDAFHREYE